MMWPSQPALQTVDVLQQRREEAGYYCDIIVVGAGEADSSSSSSSSERNQSVASRHSRLRQVSVGNKEQSM